MSKKRNVGNLKGQNASLRADVREAIERVWMHGIVELPFDPDESYFHEVHPKLQSAFRKIKEAQLLHERGADGGPVWWDQSDPKEDPPDDFERTRSYHLFFVTPVGRDFGFETEAEGFAEPEFTGEEFDEAEWEDNLIPTRIAGRGRMGWVVAVSLVAPIAVIEAGNLTTYEDGSWTEPDIEFDGETADNEPFNREEHFRKTAGPRAYKTLMNLRAKIAGILEKLRIAVLPAEEWREPVPWLRGTEDTIAGIEGRPVRVLDAFFFSEEG
jgi:hypothetical protein